MERGKRILDSMLLWYPIYDLVTEKIGRAGVHEV
jgi:hypothetical protein